MMPILARCSFPCRRHCIKWLTCVGFFIVDPFFWECNVDSYLFHTRSCLWFIPKTVSYRLYQM